MRLLHPTDFSECADAAQAETLRLAHLLGGRKSSCCTSRSRRRPTAKVCSPPASSEKSTRPSASGPRRPWRNRTARLRDHGLAVRWLLTAGLPAHEIVKVATDEGADLIVLGTHGRGGLERFLLGSVADRVIRTAPCPVVTVHTLEA